MLKNLHIKIFAVLAAITFWVLVVSLENTFFRFPNEIPIQVFNQAPELALASPLGSVRLIIRAQDQNALKNLQASDFEAYIDLRNVGAGERKVPVSVSSKKPQVSVVNAIPSEIEVTLEPVRRKTISVSPEIIGAPAEGYRVSDARLERMTVTAEGAESSLRNISSAKARIVLDGTETRDAVKLAEVVVLDRGNSVLEGVTVIEDAFEAELSIVEVNTVKQVGIRPKLTGTVTGLVKKIEVTPGVVTVSGLKDALKNLDFVETEPIELRDLGAVVEKTLRLNLPLGISLAEGEKDEVRVRIEIESNP